MIKLISVSNSVLKVNMICARFELHHDRDTHLDILYKIPAEGTINKNYILREDESHFTQLTTECMKC